MLDTLTTTWSPAATWTHLVNGDPLLILDVRNQEDVENWRVEGPHPVPTIHIPYFELLDLDDEEDLDAAVVRGIQGRLADDLPQDRPILTVCGEGHTSAHLAEGLRGLGYHAVNLEGGMEAWGDLYIERTILEEAAYTLIQINRPARGDLSHMVVSKGEAAVIDPSRHIELYERLAEQQGARVTQVLDTHAHADHISGGPGLARRNGAPYHLHPYDAIHPMDMLPARISYTPLAHDATIQVGEARLRPIHVPGHTLGMVALLLEETHLLSGDSIFLESIARPDLGGAAEAWTPLLHASLLQLLALPAATRILPGHAVDPSVADAQGRFCAELGQLHRRNKGLQEADRGLERFRSYILGSLPHFPDAYIEIKRINLGLSQPEEPEARRLEVGKNACALAEAGIAAS